MIPSCILSLYRFRRKLQKCKGAESRSGFGVKGSACSAATPNAQRPTTLRQPLVLHALRRGISTQTLFTVDFVLGVVTFKESHFRVAFVSQDVGGDTVKEPAVVRHHHHGARESIDSFFQRPQGFYIEVVGRFVQQQYVSALLQGVCQLQTATLTTG